MCCNRGCYMMQAATSGVSGDGASSTLASQSGVLECGCTEATPGCGAAAGAQQHASHRAAEQQTGVSGGDGEALSSQAARQGAAAGSPVDGQRNAAAHQETKRGPEQAGGASCSGTAEANSLPVRGMFASGSGEGLGSAGTAVPANQQQSPAPPRRFVGRRAAAAAAAASGGDAAKALAATSGSAKAQRFVRQQVCTATPLSLLTCSASRFTLHLREILS